MDMNQQPVKKSVKGFRVRNLNFVMIVFACLLYLSLLMVTYSAASTYDQIVTLTNDYIERQDYAVMVSEGSDYLTEQVRLFTVNLNLLHAENYFTESHTIRRRELALEHLNGLASSQALGYLETALDCSNELMQREVYAMRLAALAADINPDFLHPDLLAVELSAEDLALSPEEQMIKAREMVFGTEYQSTKSTINRNIRFFLNDVITSTQNAQTKSLKDLDTAMLLERIFFSILFVQNVFIFILITYLIVKPLQVYMNCMKEERLMEITGAYEFKYLALTYNDIYELNAANEIMLRHQAEHDPLTGVINRGVFERVRQMLKMKAQPIALLIIDVDHFKTVNDNYGHTTGDHVLKKVARMLVDSFRSTDFPARISGDEFAVILTDITANQQLVVEKKIQALNEALQSPTDGLPQVSLSVGGAFSEHGFTDELYNQADAALHQVKKDGRCGCRFYAEGMSAQESADQ